MTSTLAQLRDLFAYMVWADDRILSAAATCSDEGFRRDQSISAGSVHKLILHTLGAQWIWLGRWQGDSTRVFPKPEDLPTLEAIRKQWGEVHKAVLDFVNAQTDLSVEQGVEYIRNSQPHSDRLLDIMCHLVDHSTYHRGQLNSMIKLAGGKPAEVGYIAYRRIRQGQQT